jgi:hypothetical protein
LRLSKRGVCRYWINAEMGTSGMNYRYFSETTEYVTADRNCSSMQSERIKAIMFILTEKKTGSPEKRSDVCYRNKLHCLFVRRRRRGRRGGGEGEDEEEEEVLLCTNKFSFDLRVKCMLCSRDLNATRIRLTYLVNICNVELYIVLLVYCLHVLCILQCLYYFNHEEESYTVDTSYVNALT